jgi:hypothetical protein
MKIIVFLPVYLSLGAWTAAAQTGSTDEPTQESKLLFDQVDPILQGLSEITGWKIKRKVPADYISRDHLHDFIQRRVKEVLKPEDIRLEALALKMFGLIPGDFDLEKTMVDLMTEQAAAFYDYDRKRLFITESSTSFLEKRVALVHELAHALADQNYPLGKYLRKGNKNDDGETAREAVMEGQATWLMWAYVAKLGGGEAKVSDIILQTATGPAPEAGAQFPVFEKAPLYLRESLTFPYTRGLLFQNAIFEKLGKDGFSEVFRRAPAGTQQILHPEKYLENFAPLKTDPPPIPGAKGYRGSLEGAVGEFDHHVLIQQYASEEKAASIAPHWRGGSFHLFEQKSDRHPVLSYASEWDSAEAAAQFFAVYKDAVRKKSKHVTTAEDSSAKLTGENDFGRFTLTLDGTKVCGIEGLPVAAIN